MGNHLEAQPFDERPMPVLRIGVASGITGILCCVGPTVLALLGVVTASTAFVWASDLYDGFSWWFRLAALVVLLSFWVLALRRRSQCTLGGVRRSWARLAAACAVALMTYIALYALTTWLGALAI